MAKLVSIGHTLLDTSTKLVKLAREYEIDRIHKPDEHADATVLERTIEAQATRLNLLINTILDNQPDPDLLRDFYHEEQWFNKNRMSKNEKAARYMRLVRMGAISQTKQSNPREKVKEIKHEDIFTEEYIAKLREFDRKQEQAQDEEVKDEASEAPEDPMQIPNPDDLEFQ